MTFHQGAGSAKGRPVVRPIAAYCAAALTAGVTMGLSGVPFASSLTILECLAGGLVFGLMMTPYIAVFALLPSTAALAISRALELRRGLTDTIAGGLIGTLMVTLIYQLGLSETRFVEDDLIRAGQYA